MNDDAVVEESGGVTVPVDVDGQTVHFSIAPGGRQTQPELGEEQEISWRRPTLAPVLDGLTNVARAMGTRLQQTGASKATVEFGCDVSLDTGQLLAVFGKATSKSAWKVTLEWTAPGTPPGTPAPGITGTSGTPAPGTPPAPAPGTTGA
ncbi:CU044_2847 family protein [Streptomyces sp. NPDC059802]|uniref:CU044_2847 family protein n=1 Tax=Streptomyces sp. NPDC059802 TaxID=3346952 RepID=UPI00364E74B1